MREGRKGNGGKKELKCVISMYQLPIKNEKLCTTNTLIKKMVCKLLDLSGISKT